jgi:hypothetical protein
MSEHSEPFGGSIAIPLSVPVAQIVLIGPQSELLSGVFTNRGQHPVARPSGSLAATQETLVEQ